MIISSKLPDITRSDVMNSTKCWRSGRKLSITSHERLLKTDGWFFVTPKEEDLQRFSLAWAGRINHGGHGDHGGETCWPSP